ncbi:MAG: ATP-dependent phosphofructokinase / diphosphate-dependent phosphofructokinase [Acidobacteriota bacterium]|nr:ATP-dependent phosphofructokinase / diphosphate-dependent phosphofructokinase [Acidobacteriota bacterium]MDT7780402.1 ATP-dependent phosphofructokinase / diphosphate-dependent phosphofructokinase [Acidobacteriota bacterium]
MGLRVGILTGGGDCPGLNAVIRAVVRRSMLEEQAEVFGVKNGWRGLIEDDLLPLTRLSVTGILPRGGTILGTSRTNPQDGADFPQRIRATWSKYGLDALIVVGGEGTLRAARDVWHENGLPIVGIPKTIDNDLDGTDFPFGFDTAVNTVMEAIDRLHSTAESHHRVMVIEVMGRHSGWIAAYGGIAGGADVILVPEHPFRLSRVCELLRHRERQGSAFSIIVVAEDAHPHPDENFLDEETQSHIYRRGRLGGIGFLVANEVERTTGIETRHANLGYVQRGGSPSAFDRVLATRFGVKAFEMVLEKQWGQMVALRGNKVACIPLDDAVRRIKLLDEEIYHVAEVFFG